MKTCFKCHAELPLSEFYAHPFMADGHLGKCKTCTRRDVGERRTKMIDYYRAYDRARGKLPHRKANNKLIGAKEHKMHPERNPARLRARRTLRQMPESCQMCNGTGLRLERHHPDYSLPLMVVWLCKPCHCIADKARREQEKQRV